jgi:hypothetical protein
MRKNSRQSKHRKTRVAKKTYSIIVDGQTEMWYFQMMKQYEQLATVDIKPELPKKKKLVELFETVKANSYLGYEKVIWLVDFDTLVKEEKERKKGSPSVIKEFETYVKKLKSYDNVVVLVNNPCLEFWYLLHFEATGKYYPQCEGAEKSLKNSLPNYEKTERYYKKVNQDIYTQLKSNQAQAKQNGKRLGNFDFSAPLSAKAEVFEILNVLGIA